ncbi:hypothetical protein [Thomasclavelia cocleata]|uniref:hypothetical protein n=1 Tax=Thomasclavelia cocleata TaxID=69824 RepID=UPI0012FD8770|nr:hypothetical protein [Thomasclavelia cocleata]MCR1961428.1 hypothetical protein [Thomasclavelia cocleata]
MYEELKEQTKDLIEAVRKAPELVKGFIHRVIHSENKNPAYQLHKKHEQSL